MGQKIKRYALDKNIKWLWRLGQVIEDYEIKKCLSATRPIDKK